jgi:ankyrin repeat protein
MPFGLGKSAKVGPDAGGGGKKKKKGGGMFSKLGGALESAAKTTIKVVDKSLELAIDGTDKAATLAFGEAKEGSLRMDLKDQAHRQRRTYRDGAEYFIHLPTNFYSDFKVNKEVGLSNFPAVTAWMSGSGDTQDAAANRQSARWLCSAIDYAATKPGVKKSAKELLSVERFTSNLSQMNLYQQIKEHCKMSLGKIGKELDAYYVDNGLRVALGPGALKKRGLVTLDEQTEGGFRRQDILDDGTGAPFVGLRPPARPSADGEGKSNEDWPFFEQEAVYIHILRLTALAINKTYLDIARVLCEKNEGEFSGCNIKGDTRIRSKAHSAEDHGNEKRPRPAMNIDVNRNCCTFQDPEHLLDYAEALSKHPSLTVARIKNGFHLDDDEGKDRKKAKAQFHLRVFMMNLLYDHGKTFGELAAESNVQKKWTDYVNGPSESTSVSRYTWHKQALAAKMYLESAEMRNRPVKLIVESQVLLQEYKDARTKMHFLYKVVRADSDLALYRQFATGTDSLRKANHAKAHDNDLSWEAGQAKDTLVEKMRAKEGIENCAESMCELLREACVNGKVVHVEHILGIIAGDSASAADRLASCVNATYGKVLRDWAEPEQMCIDTHAMAWPIFGGLGMPNGAICFKCHSIRAQKYCKHCHLCAVCCAGEHCQPCNQDCTDECRHAGGEKKCPCRWCKEQDKCEAQCKACVKKIVDDSEDPCRDPDCTDKKLCESCTEKSKHLCDLCGTCKHTDEGNQCKGTSNPCKKHMDDEGNFRKCKKLANGKRIPCKKHDHMCCKPSRFQYCVLKGRYPKEMLIYERMSARADLGNGFKKLENPEKDAAAAIDFSRALRNKADVNEKDPDTGVTALMITAEKGCPQALEALLRDSQQDVDVNAQSRGSMETALMCAVKNGQTKCVEVLLKQPGINVEAQNNNGETAQDLAMTLSKNGEPELGAVLTKLLEGGGVATSATSSGEGESKISAEATKKKRGSRVGRVYSGALNLVEKSYDSVLTISKKISDDKPVEYDGTIPSVEGTGFTNFRWHWPETKTVHYLQPFSALKKKIPRGGQCPSCATYNPTLQHCKTCYCCENCAPNLFVCMSSKCKEDHQKTALLLACEEDHFDVVECLLRIGGEHLDVNKEDANIDNPGRRPLTAAAMLGYENVVASLLQHEKIDVNTGDRNDGWTPLMHAAVCGHEGVVRLLLKHPNIDITTTTLHRCIADKSPDGDASSSWTWLMPRHEVKMSMSLSEAKSSGLLKGRPKAGSGMPKAHSKYAVAKAKVSELSFSFQKGDSKVVRRLDPTRTWFQSMSIHEKGLWFPVKAVEGFNDEGYLKMSQPGDTALTLACRSGHLGVVRLLLDASLASYHRVNGCVSTLWAACNGSVDSVALSVLKAVDGKRFSGALSAQVMDTMMLNLAKTSNNMTPLIAACLRDNSDTAEWLLEQDSIDIFAQCKPESGGLKLTALIAACQVGNVRIVRALKARCEKEGENGNAGKVAALLEAENTKGWTAIDACKLAYRRSTGLIIKKKLPLSDDRREIVDMLEEMKKKWLSEAQQASMAASAERSEAEAFTEAKAAAEAMKAYEQEQKEKEAAEKALAPEVFAELAEAEEKAMQQMAAAEDNQPN